MHLSPPKQPQGWDSPGCPSEAADLQCSGTTSCPHFPEPSGSDPQPGKAFPLSGSFFTRDGALLTVLDLPPAKNFRKFQLFPWQLPQKARAQGRSFPSPALRLSLFFFFFGSQFAGWLNSIHLFLLNVCFLSCCKIRWQEA